MPLAFEVQLAGAHRLCPSLRNQEARDPKFRAALLIEGVQSLVAGDVETGKVILRDYINATGGFEKLGEAAKMPPKSLMRMFGPRGNPTASNLFSVLAHLQRRDQVRLQIRRGK